MKPKVLKTEQDYEDALKHVESLMDVAPGSPEADELEVFALLVEAYEKEHYPIDLPDPIEAIKFRMEQAGLTQKDVAPYFGGQSRVSEVLNRKRSLSLSMMRALHEGLGIPAEVLLQKPGQEIPEQQYNPRDFPFTEMYRRCYFAPFQGTLPEAKMQGESLLVRLFSVFQGRKFQPIHCRRADRDVDVHALLAWQAQVLHMASREDLPVYEAAALDDVAIRELVKQSYFSSGPQNAREVLNRWGIHLIVLPHLPRTYLDGASFLSTKGHPIIGLTLRHDRLDNFWFTLMHELAHILLHLQDQDAAFFDDTERPSQATNGKEENEANDFAQEMLIPSQIWQNYSRRLLRSNRRRPVEEAALELRICPAIVAGRIRWETGDYRRYGSLVGSRQVREQFAEYGAGLCQK